MSFTKLIRAWSKNYPGFLWVIHIWRWISFYPNFWLIVVSFLSHSTSPTLILWFIKRGQHRTLLEILWVPAAWRYTKDKFSPNAYLWRGQIFVYFLKTNTYCICNENSDHLTSVPTVSSHMVERGSNLFTSQLILNLSLLISLNNLFQIFLLCPFHKYVGKYCGDIYRFNVKVSMSLPKASLSQCIC